MPESDININIRTSVDNSDFRQQAIARAEEERKARAAIRADLRARAQSDIAELSSHIPKPGDNLPSNPIVIYNAPKAIVDALAPGFWDNQAAKLSRSIASGADVLSDKFKQLTGSSSSPLECLSLRPPSHITRRIDELRELIRNLDTIDNEESAPVTDFSDVPEHIIEELSEHFSSLVDDSPSPSLDSSPVSSPPFSCQDYTRRRKEAQNRAKAARKTGDAEGAKVLDDLAILYKEEQTRRNRADKAEAAVGAAREKLDAQPAATAEHRAQEASLAAANHRLAQRQQQAAEKVAHTLEAMDDELRVSGSYTAKDRRTQAQIHAADAAALTERRRRLTALRDTPNMDAATLRQINTKIRETDDQLHGLHDAMHQSAVEAQRVVAGLQPLGQQAKNRGAQGALKRAERAYQRLAQRAERQASRGDTQALERTQAAMRRNALQQEKLTGYTGRAAARQREVEGHLQALAQGTAAQDRGLTAQQRVENAIRQQLEGRRRHSARAAQAERRAAAAAESNAKAAERRNPRAQAQQVANLTQQLSTATTALNEMKAEVGRLDGAIAQLATVAGQAAQAAASGAQVAAGKLAGLQNQVNGLKQAVAQLRRA